MKKIMLSLALGAFVLIPGDSSGFPRPPAARPAYRPPAAMPIHTPAYVAPRPVAPIYHPPYRPPVAVQPIVRPPVAVQPIVRPPVAVQPIVRPPVGIVRPPVVQPIVRPPVVGIGNRPVVVNRNVMVNRGVYINRGASYYRPGYSYYHGYYDGWHHGYWGGWYNRPWLWYGGGVAAGWLWANSPNVVYANPYWQAPPYYTGYDYGQPIQVPQPVQVQADPSPITDPYDPTLAQNVQSAPPDDPNAAAGAKILDDARQAFLANDYDAALKLADQAISTSPKDTTLHEFRALVLFAQRRYQEAAATIYGVLAVGPGWDWATLSSFYRDPATYTAQMRALETYTKANPKDAAARFLLAYHYLTTDYRDAAITTLRSVVALQPSDQLAAYLLKMVVENKGQANIPPPGN